MLLKIPDDFWQFRTELKNDRIRSLPGNPTKSITFWSFSKFLTISVDFWKFRTELKISIEFHPYQEIPQNWSLSGASQNSWRFLAISSKTETIDRIPSLPGNPIKPITFWSFWKSLSISDHFKQNWKLLIVMVRASSPARQWQYDITRTAVTGQCVLSHNYYIP